MIVFVSDSKVVNLRAEKDKLEETYSVDNGKAKGEHFEATISEKTLSFKTEGENLSFTLIE